MIDTRRQRIRALLEKSFNGKSPSELSDQLYYKYDEEVGVDEVLEHIEHLKSSGEDILVRPPMCKECRFDNFDNLLNVPSQCPECRSEWLSEPVFTIEVD